MTPQQKTFMYSVIASAFVGVATWMYHIDDTVNEINVSTQLNKERVAKVASLISTIDTLNSRLRSLEVGIAKLIIQMAHLEGAQANKTKDK